jgi:hypothetical protein
MAIAGTVIPQNLQLDRPSRHFRLRVRLPETSASEENYGEITSELKGL